jgi:DNA polymerase-1
MINIHNKMTNPTSNIQHSKLILQVHDELLFDAHKNEIEQLKKLVVEEMENAMQIAVPIKAEVGIGENWLEAH